MIQKILSKKVIIIFVVFFVLLLIFWNSGRNNKNHDLDLVEVVRGDIFREVSETGQVRKGEQIQLGFKSSGRMEKIYVEVGDEVKAGQTLAKIETKDLAIRLQEAKADLKIYQVRLDDLMQGASEEEIQKVRTAVLNAEVSLENANKNLESINTQTEENLNAAYEDALNGSDTAYLKAYNAQIFVNYLQRTYFTNNDQGGIKVKDNEKKIEGWVSSMKSFLDIAKESSEHEDIDSLLSETIDGLSNIYNSLEVIRAICQEDTYRNSVSSADKTSLDTYKTNINGSLTNTSNYRQTVFSTKTTNKLSINTAEASVSTARGVLNSAEDEFSLITAPPQENDINLSQAQIEKVQIQIRFLENQIQDSYLISPLEGQIAQINKREGEMVSPSPGQEMIVLLPKTPFKVKADIYEEDVVEISLNDSVDISLIAFPEVLFKGKVISIDPAEKIIDGIVCYEISIGFESAPEIVKSGMTADILIRTDSRKNVLFIPEEAIEEKDGRKIVMILENEIIKEREIETGLLSTDRTIEVISGLSEGEKVILP